MARRCRASDNPRMRPRRRIAALAVVLALAAASPVAALTRPPPIVVGFPPLPLTGVVIALDPGHNGGNAAHASEIAKPVFIGTMWKPCNKVGTSTTGGYPEHAFTFDVALRVKGSLE